MKAYYCRQWLMRKYAEEGLSIRQIAYICGVRFATIHYWLVKFGIPRMPRGKSRRERIKTRDIHVSMSENLFLSLVRLSNNRGESMSSLASEALEDYMLRNNFNPFLEREFKAEREKNV